MARSLEVQEHLATQRRIKVAQLAGIVLLLLGLAAALLGVFGDGGPMAEARTREGAMEVTYPRFARALAHTSITVRTERATSETVALTLRGELSRALLVETIVPRPVQVASAGDATVYRFAAVPGQPHRVWIDGQFESVGAVAGSVRVDDGPAIPVDTFVYP